MTGFYQKLFGQEVGFGTFSTITVKAPDIAPVPGLGENVDGERLQYNKDGKKYFVKICLPAAVSVCRSQPQLMMRGRSSVLLAYSSRIINKAAPY